MRQGDSSDNSIPEAHRSTRTSKREDERNSSADSLSDIRITKVQKQVFTATEEEKEIMDDEAEFF